MGHPVCVETDGFDTMIATRFGLSGLETSMDALLIAYSSCASNYWVVVQGLRARVLGDRSWEVDQPDPAICPEVALPDADSLWSSHDWHALRPSTGDDGTPVVDFRSEEYLALSLYR
jgi:hypothetical protein